VNKPGIVTVARAKEARKTRIGAYYRINHRLADFHAAINETGAIFVSASVHKGWSLKFTKAKSLPVITKHPLGPTKPGHAFCLVGYNDKGFIVQNSWGKQWAKAGFAIWSYEDWYENIRDAWVFRLSLSTPSIWQVSTRLKTGQPNTAGETKSSKPVRSEIAGHFVHIDDGKFHDHGAYSSNLEDVRQTAQLIADSAKDKYQHLLFYAHGGLNSPVDSARRIRGMKDVFKDNKIYPYHFMYDTGVTEEIKDVIHEKLNRASERTGSFSDVTDRAIEKLLRGMGRSIWREMKLGAQLPFAEQYAGWQVAAEFLMRIQQSRPDIQIHLVGHSTGAILLAYLLDAMEAQYPTLRVSTVSLLAPAITTELFSTHYKPLLASPQNLFGIDAMTVYNLSDELERDDTVAGVYRKSLLYLVSRSFEEELGGEKEEDTQNEQRGARILGMQRYSVPVDRKIGKQAEFLYSGTAKANNRTGAESHGGFDNDIETMNDVLRSVLKRKRPGRLFNQQDLSY
jgi:pimeloyl-ACP methyl ester carboxylesterase